MVKVEVYSASLCGYCSAAKRLLSKKSIDFIEYVVDQDTTLRGEMTQRSGGRSSVPQIFIDDAHIGGFDELMELEADDELDALLGS